jgi:hypothetical protein
VKRGDAAEVLTPAEDKPAVRRRSGSLLDLKEPHFLSIVKAPANRTPFKIVREDIPRRRRRLDGSLLSVQLPSETSDEEAQEVFKRFGLSSEEYAISKDEEGVYFKRVKLEDGEQPTVPIRLPGGAIAHISASALEKGIERAADHPGLSVMQIEFERDDKEAAVEWLKTRSMNASVEDLKAGETGGLIFTRHELPKNVTFRSVEVDAGVLAVVALTQRDDIPRKIYRAVIESAYGQYGWGSLDFNQAMADMEFSEDAREANEVLWSVLNEILFWSSLPLADRHALVMNTLNEYAVWLTNLMSALPRQMIEPNRIDLNSQGTQDDNAARSDSETSKETAEMKPKEAKGVDAKETVAREDAAGSEAKTEGNAAPVERTDDQPVTRGEIKTLVAEALKEALATRSEDKPETPATPEKTVERGDNQVGDILAVVKDLQKTVVERVDALTTRVGEMEQRTVTRGEEDPPQVSEEVRRQDPYRGSIFRRNPLYG